MARKNSKEIKASLLRRKFAEKWTFTALVQFGLAMHRKKNIIWEFLFVTLEKIDHASELDDDFWATSEHDLISPIKKSYTKNWFN